MSFNLLLLDAILVVVNITSHIFTEVYKMKCQQHKNVACIK